MILEIQQCGGGSIKGSSLRVCVTLLWNDFVRQHSLNLVEVLSYFFLVHQIRDKLIVRLPRERCKIVRQ